MTAAEVKRYDSRNGTQVIVRLKNGVTHKGTWVGYLDKGGTTCGILIGTNEGQRGEIVEVLFKSIKSLT